MVNNTATAYHGDTSHRADLLPEVPKVPSATIGLCAIEWACSNQGAFFEVTHDLPYKCRHPDMRCSFTGNLTSEIVFETHFEMQGVKDPIRSYHVAQVLYRSLIFSLLAMKAAKAASKVVVSVWLGSEKSGIYKHIFDSSRKATIHKSVGDCQLQIQQTIYTALLRYWYLLHVQLCMLAAELTKVGKLNLGFAVQKSALHGLFPPNTPLLPTCVLLPTCPTSTSRTFQPEISCPMTTARLGRAMTWSTLRCCLKPYCFCVVAKIISVAHGLWSATNGSSTHGPTNMV